MPDPHAAPCAGYFERVLNWTGICVEPNPEVFPRIAGQAGRSSGVQLAVSDRHGKLPFVAAYMRSSLNASAVDYNFLASQGVAATSVEVDVTTPAALLAAHRVVRDAPVLDYVSIDVEQLELPILRVWPYARHCVRVFNIENEPPEGTPSALPQLRALLEPLGYRYQLRIGVDEVFVRTTPCAGQRVGGRAGAAASAAAVPAFPRATRQLRGLATAHLYDADAASRPWADPARQPRHPTSPLRVRRRRAAQAHGGE